MSEKVFKTIDEQIEILRSRGLSITDEKQAKEFLLHNNYYRISGFSLTLRNADDFYENTTFQNIIDIYKFDFELRHILMKHLETIEVQMKSVYAYRFTSIHTPTDFLNDCYFTDKSKHKEIIDKAEKQKERRLNHEAYLKHFVNDLNVDIPLWAYVDLLTISDISFLYSISQSDVKQLVAHDFGLHMKKGPEILGRLMHSMTILRNLCAHGSRLYNRLFEQKPFLSKKSKQLLREDENGRLDNAHLYGFVLVMKQLLPSDAFDEMKNSIIELTNIYPFVRMSYYGFRDDWKEKL